MTKASAALQTSRPALLPDAPSPSADRETRAAFAICLNAINFGSGWWPTIRKRPGLSGYSTIAAGVGERFREAGAWTAEELAAIDVAGIATVVGQEPEHPLMPQFSAALRDVGAHVLAEHGGRFETVVDDAGGSAAALATELGTWSAFADTSLYRERPVPLFKRAQLAAASGLSPAEIDGVLWNRGREARYKAVPRPRSRNTAY